MPLKILICGGGIAGLTAASSLARHGHQVEIYEKSSFSAEIGAALHLGPIAMRVLNDLEMDISKLQACTLLEWRICDWNQKVLDYKTKTRQLQAELDVKEDELMMYRIDLHNMLRENALKYPNVQIHLSSEIANVDTEAGKITLVDGRSFSGDLVLGADGIHSKSLKGLQADVPKVSSKGINMYRFMVETEHAMKHPSTAKFLSSYPFQTTHDTFHADGTGFRALVMYPCRNGTLLNCATFQPEAMEKKKIPEADYNCPGTLEEVLELFEGWPDHFQHLFKSAKDIKHWKVVMRDIPRQYNNGKLALLGDAAHPTQPVHGAGAAMAIEDAGVLGVVFDSTATSDSVPRRLELYNQLRYERTAILKYGSELFGKDTWERRKACGVLQKPYLGHDWQPRDMNHYLWSFHALAQAKLAMQDFGT